MTSEQAFEILEIKDHNIDESSLKKAFYSAARKTHPDSNPDDEAAQAKFQLIREAYDVLCAYLQYENKRKSAAKQAKKTARTAAAAYTSTRKTTGSTAKSSAKASSGSTAKSSAKASSGSTAKGSAKASSGSGKDVWEAYVRADKSYAKKRHTAASERAEETIRNHVKRENEKTAREAKEQAAREKAQREQEERERKAKEAAERRLREEQEARKRAQQEQKRREQRKRMQQQADEAAEQVGSFLHRFCNACRRFWDRYISPNHALKYCILILLISLVVLWTGMEIFGAVRSIRNLVQKLSAIAKWILIVWLSCRLTIYVHRKRRNWIFSAFAFLVSMEVEIFLLNWFEDTVRMLHWL
jgi:curved DNA-binding protein CbpA